MPIVQFILVLVAIGVIMWLVNTYAAPYIAQPWLKLINVVAIIATILWVLNVFGIFGYVSGNVPMFHR